MSQKSSLISVALKILVIPISTIVVDAIASENTINKGTNTCLCSEELDMRIHYVRDRFQSIETRKLPRIIETTPEENSYIFRIIAIAIDVIHGKKYLSEHDPDFGQGSFFIPKDRGEPKDTSLSYRSNNFDIQTVQLNFKRTSADRPWHMASVNFFPRNFPNGIFQMDLKDSYFKKFEFEKAYFEKRVDHSVRNVNIFVYKELRANDPIKLIFEARADITSLQDRYPRSFHYMRIEKDLATENRFDLRYLPRSQINGARP